MKNNKGILALGGIFLVLGIGYFIPSIVMWLKDWALIYEENEVEIEAIQLDSQNVDMMEALRVFSDMISSQIIVDVGDSFEMTYAEAIKDKEASVQNELYKSMQDFVTMLDVKEEAVLVELSAQNYAMMAQGDEDKVYSIWVCEGIDKNENKYLFWVDATLNKVMAFDVPFVIFGKGDEAFYVGLDRVIEYYDFASYGSPIHSYAMDMGELLKTKYRNNEVEILDKKLDIILSLKFCRDGDRFLFNLETGSKNVTYYGAE